MKLLKKFNRIFIDKKTNLGYLAKIEQQSRRFIKILGDFAVNNPMLAAKSQRREISQRS